MSNPEAITEELEKFSLEIPKKITGLMSSQLLIFERLNIQSRQIHRDRKQISGCQGIGFRRNEGGWLPKGTECLLEVIKCSKTAVIAVHLVGAQSLSRI